MKRNIFHCIGSVLAMGLVATPAMAWPGVTPINTYFSANGAMTLVKQLANNQQSIWPCALNFNATTGPITYRQPDSTNIISISAFTTSNVGNCNNLRIRPTTMTIVSANANGGTGYLTSFNSFTYRPSDNVEEAFCSGSYIPVTFINNGAGQTSIQIVGTFGSCTITAEVKVCPDINAVDSIQY